MTKRMIIVNAAYLFGAFLVSLAAAMMNARPEETMYLPGFLLAIGLFIIVYAVGWLIAVLPPMEND